MNYWYSITANIKVKVILAGVLTFLHDVLELVLSHTYPLIEIDGVLVFAVALLVVLDFVTGVAASRRQGDKFKGSVGFRRTIVKSLQYMAFAGAAAIVGNAFGSAPIVGPAVEHFGVLAVFVVALTELWSIAENLYGSKGAKKMLGRLKWVLKIGDNPENLANAIEGKEESNPPE